MAEVGNLFPVTCTHAHMDTYSNVKWIYFMHLIAYSAMKTCERHERE